MMAYGIFGAAGSDWNEIKVRDIESPASRSRRPHQVGEILRCFVDEGRQGLLLLPLRRAEVGHEPAQGRELFPQALLPQASARRSREDVLVYRPPRSKGVGLQWRASRMTGGYLTIHVWKGTDTQEPFLLQGSLETARTRRWSSCSMTSTRTTASSTTSGRRLLLPHGPQRPARPRHRHRRQRSPHRANWREVDSADAGSAARRRP